MGGHPETNTNSNSTDGGSKSQAGRNHKVTSEAVVNPALSRECSWGGRGVLPRPKRENPYLPTGVPRNPRHDDTKAGLSSAGPIVTTTTFGVGVPLWSALLSKLDDNAVATMSVPFHSRMIQRVGKYLVPMKLFPLKAFKASSASFQMNI
jgi:hypothetical protein